ncbi:replication restart helicase PriA [Deinococcus sonorensis]|uniref:Probable replication restart protein PriA n=2 Tax=Deinococcus sonorensis TaxID=309891 RepID=A0AAU7UEB7_9DEIO
MPTRPSSPSAVRPWLVALPLPIGPCDFAAPHGTAGGPPLGCRVLVPWRGELTVGLVVGEGEGKGQPRLREVVQVLDPSATPHVGPGFLAAIRELAAAARLPLGLLCSDLIGVGWTARVEHRVRAVAGADLSAFGVNVPGPDFQDAEHFDPLRLDSIREQGLLDEHFGPLARTVSGYQAVPWEHLQAQERVVVRWEAREGQITLTGRQQDAWRWLSEHGPQPSPAAWARGAGVSGSVVSGVIERGWAAQVGQPATAPAAWTVLRDRGPFPSQAAWAEAAGVPISTVARLLARGWATQVQLPAPAPALPDAAPRGVRPAPDTLPEAPLWRLHGGRASERHARLAARIRRLLDVGRGVLVLAPDAATLRQAWQDLSGLAQGCGTAAVCYNGTLSEPQREHAWTLIQSERARLVIGSALALAAPLPDLGLIVVLEEASDAHKLLSGSRVFLPDLALRAARYLETPLAYVGCVPAAETLHHPGEVLPPPRVRLHIVDYGNPQQQAELGPLSSPHLRPGDLGYPLSHDLARVLRQVQERGRQAALLAPRRGYSALLRCPGCQHTPGCPHCDVPLRFHQEQRALHCHQCGFHTAIPDRCDECGEPMWQARGPGTEWIAQEVRRLLPGFPVYRYDRDQQDDLALLQQGEPGVVVGTQALLSLDAPPNLALLGITLADTWLAASDFRAGERYHRLLRQLSEWHPSRAPLLVVQTFQAQHPALQALRSGHNAELYVQAERRARKALGYPPYRLLAHVEVAARDRDRARVAAQEVADALYGAGADAQELLGPAPSPLSRVKGVYPYQLLLRPRDEARLGVLLGALDRRFAARVRVDVSPRGMML